MILFETIKFVKKILPQKYKIKALKISFLLVVNSALELIGLSAILPLFVVLLDDNIKEKYAWANWLIENFNLSNENQLITLLAVILLLVIIFKNLCSLWIIKEQSVFALSLYKDFTLKMHQYYYKKGFLFFKQLNSNIIVRNIGCSENFALKHILGTLNLLNELLIILIIIISITLYDINVIILLLLTVGISFFVFYTWVRKKSLAIGEVKNRVAPILNKNIFQSIYGFVDIKIAGAQHFFRQKISKNIDEIIKVNIKSNIYNLMPTKIIETSLMMAITVMVIYGVYFLPSKTDLIKLLGLFVVAGYRIIPSINRITMALNDLNQYKWIMDVLAPLENYVNKENIESMDFAFNKQLKLENIEFRYPKNDVSTLKNFSLTIKKGEVIGLVGPSGAGKTTVMNLLLGFLKPSKGTYYIDDVLLGEQNISSFYKKVGYVQQQVYLVDGTLAENIAFGCEPKDIDINKLNRILKQASLWDMVQSWPEGVYSSVGENGTKLSGGQRQRVGIARALYFGAEILFFDEATSSLDSQTEKEISESIYNLTDGKITIIIIAHRVSTLDSCNRIIEVNKNN